MPGFIAYISRPWLFIAPRSMTPRVYQCYTTSPIFPNNSLPAFSRGGLFYSAKHIYPKQPKQNDCNKKIPETSPGLSSFQTILKKCTDHLYHSESHINLEPLILPLIAGAHIIDIVQPYHIPRSQFELQQIQLRTCQQ